MDIHALGIRHGAIFGDLLYIGSGSRTVVIRLHCSRYRPTIPIAHRETQIKMCGP